MAINVTKVAVLNNSVPFNAPLQFEITFDCVELLSDDLEWRVTYVGSATSSDYDQILDTLLVGPVVLGVNRFVLETPAPDITTVPEEDLIGATVMLITCSYKGKEFVRVGFWVANQYTEPLAEGEAIPKPIAPEKIIRRIVDDRPRVTRFPIEWR